MQMISSLGAAIDSRISGLNVEDTDENVEYSGSEQDRAISDIELELVGQARI